MSVDPKILEHMKAARDRNRVDPEDDGSEGAVLDDEPSVPTQAYIDGMTPLTGAPLAQRGQSLGLPDLTGTPKQIKWALTIREDALSLAWPPETQVVLKSIVDSTWWIANKAIVHTMKFKAPSPHQMAGGPPPPPPASGRTQPGPPPAQPHAPPAPAATSSPHQKRLDDAILWAESVSRHPTLAQAAILSCLRFAYPKGAMRNQITAKAREILAQANMEVNRDTSAIQLMLSKE